MLLLMQSLDSGLMLLLIQSLDSGLIEELEALIVVAGVVYVTVVRVDDALCASLGLTKGADVVASCSLGSADFRTSVEDSLQSLLLDLERKGI